MTSITGGFRGTKLPLKDFYESLYNRQQHVSPSRIPGCSSLGTGSEPPYSRVRLEGHARINRVHRLGVYDEDRRRQHQDIHHHHEALFHVHMYVTEGWRAGKG